MSSASLISLNLKPCPRSSRWRRSIDNVKTTVTEWCPVSVSGVNLVLAICCTAIKRSARSTNSSLAPGKTSRCSAVRASVICAVVINAVYFRPRSVNEISSRSGFSMVVVTGYGYLGIASKSSRVRDSLVFWLYQGAKSSSCSSSGIFAWVKRSLSCISRLRDSC